MIYKRAVARLRAQDWMAIAIELAIVIIGVFIGIQVANWNQERLEKSETRELLRQLSPELHRLSNFSDRAVAYFDSSRHYAEVAFAGWRNDPRVNDRDFVIAAYQASQIMGVPNDSQSWALVFGADKLRQIEDPQLRSELARMMTYDYDQLSRVNVATPYRQHVRQVIPDSIQQQIRAKCGDVQAPDSALILPARCEINLPRDEVAEIASDLRRHPELVDELDYHLSEVASLLGRLTRYVRGVRQVAERIDGSANS